MKITKLISVFERLLPIYKEAYESNYCYTTRYLRGLNAGLCLASFCSCKVSLDEVMNGYYKNLMSPTTYFGFSFLFPMGELKPRIDFMEREIKSLKRLMKKGFTDI